MENGIYLGLSRQAVLRTNMDIIANNIANVNTSGYRGQNLLFQEYLSDPRGADDALSFVIDEGHYQATTPGSLKFTGNQLDIALEGPGFIGVQSPEGEVAYTRDGGFEINAEGFLVTHAGHPVADTGGASITIPAGSSEIKIDERGVVSNQDGQLGQINLSEFDNIQQLEARGDNLYHIVGGNAVPATQTRVQQGQIEGSNVNAVIETTRMIETLRQFQSIQQVMQGENQRLRTAIQRLTGQG